MCVRKRAFLIALSLAVFGFGQPGVSHAQQVVDLNAFVDDTETLDQVDQRTPLKTAQGFMRFAELGEFSIDVEVFAHVATTDRNSETRLDVSGGPMGTPVDLEKDLGVDASASVLRLDGYYRFNDKHRIDLSRNGRSERAANSSRSDTRIATVH